jgi:endo-1,4-beta-mannosidase
MSEKFILGVNYWPRRKAMYWWANFEAAEVREEFAQIRDFGMSVVRIFLLWDDWMPTPDAVSADCLANLKIVADTAAEFGLGLDITFFTGHMSGPNWSPRWLLDATAPKPADYVKQVVTTGGEIVQGYYRNPYTDPQALDAERLLLREVVTLLKDHPGVWMWNLGNEPDLFAWPPTPEAGRAWVREMTHLIKSIDPVRPVTCGLHSASLLQDNNLRIHDVYGETDVAVMHSYPMYMPWAKGPLDPDLVPYTCALVTALCGKPTLMEEFGGCTTEPGKESEVWEWMAYDEPRTQFMASETDFADYIAAVLPRLIDVGATGAMMWCYADYIPELWDMPPCKESKHERFFGLVRPDGSVKPHAEVIKAFAATNPTVQPATHTVTLTVTPEKFYEAPALYTVSMYDNYLAQSKR